MENRLTIILLFCSALCSASTCPETRKPHITDCSVYYECINLPDGGYVWAPAKCQEGLPYLRLCVLPGSTWTCVESQTHPSANIKPLNTPELINKTPTTYHELNRNSFDSHRYFDVNNFFSLTPYPLIKVEKQNKITSGINSIERKKIEKFSGNSQVILYKKNPESTPSSTPICTTPVIIDASSNEFFVKLIRNYIFNKTVNTKSDKRKIKNRSTTTERIDTAGDVPEITTTTYIPLNDELIDEANNIIAIRGNLGSREYITIEKYKSLSTKLMIEVLDIVPCITGIRLPNATNCMRYYTCQPKKAVVHEFTCPQNTAFNGQINLCDSHKYKSCTSRIDGVQVEKLILVQDSEEEKLKDDNPCEKTGKFADKTSEKFYYLCYTDGNSEEMNFVRLTCPNNLMFCEKRKICASKRFCYD